MSKDAPESDKSVEDRAARRFTSRFIKVGGRVGAPSVYSVGDGAGNAESDKDEEVDEYVEVCLLLDLAPFRRSVACTEATGLAIERKGEKFAETYLD